MVVCGLMDFCNVIIVIFSLQFFFDLQLITIDLFFCIENAASFTVCIFVMRNFRLFVKILNTTQVRRNYPLPPEKKRSQKNKHILTLLSKKQILPRGTSERILNTEILSTFEYKKKTKNNLQFSFIEHLHWKFIQRTIKLY